MYTLAFILLIVAQLTSVFAAGYGLTQAGNPRNSVPALVEKGHILVTGQP